MAIKRASCLLKLLKRADSRETVRQHSTIEGDTVMYRVGFGIMAIFILAAPAFAQDASKPQSDGFDANYGESTVDDSKETTVENARLFAGARKTMTERSFWSLNGEYLYDDIADIDYRATLGT